MCVNRYAGMGGCKAVTLRRGDSIITADSRDCLIDKRSRVFLSFLAITVPPNIRWGNE
jgi:hypothetical protein